MKKIAKIYVGVDASKDSSVVHLYPIDATFTVAHTKAGMKKLLGNLAKYEVGQIVCESSGGYEHFLYKSLANARYKVWQELR
jgi:transposase